MRRIVWSFVCAALLAVVGWRLSAPRPRFSEADWQRQEKPGDALAGRRIFFAGGCGSCHATPGQPDPLRLGGGLELKTPFGSFYPPNISSDPADGVGGWRDVDFANALLSGVSPNGEHYYPALPYTSYQRMNPGDVADLIAFLRTLPPVSGGAPAHKLSFPFSIRRALGFWKLLYFDNAGPQSVAGQSETWNLGRYLVDGPGHCGECHTPRGVFGEMLSGQALIGAPSPDGKGKSPSLIGGKFADWTKADIVEALSSGFTPSGDALGGAMAAVVRNTAQLRDAGREAIAVYLKSLALRKAASAEL
jgi:mono/diheme cytochrome c family protein